MRNVTTVVVREFQPKLFRVSFYDKSNYQWHYLDGFYTEAAAKKFIIDFPVLITWVRLP
jgi:hypothetical protein